MLDLFAVLALSQACAPSVAPETLTAIAHVESRFDPLAIGVNRGGQAPPSAQNAASAARLARRLLDDGANIDLGLAQINSSNLSWLGMTVEDAFDPCRNLAAAATVLRAGYRRPGDGAAGAQTALRIALSRYNTGDASRGFRNGYVRRVEDAAVALRLATPTTGEVRIDGPPASAETPAPRPPAPAWDVFGQPETGAIVFPVKTPR